MKVGAFCCLAYGADYLGYAIRSVYDQVDVIFCLYAREPSHGHGTSLPCPDSRDDVYNAAFQFGDPGNKIRWIEGTWKGEGVHRDAVYPLARDEGVDLIVTVDADEIWDAESLAQGIELTSKSPARVHRTHFVHFWRSFQMVCRDGMTPERFARVTGHDGSFAYTPSFPQPVFHFGYARKPADVEYKMSVHGHKGEIKGNWFEKKFLAWTPGMRDVHPTCNDIWHPEPFERSQLPEFMRTHPYFDLELIT